MSSNYSNEFHLPIDYYLLNCSSRVSPRRIKLNRLQQQISCPQQQTYRQTYVAQQVPLAPQQPQKTTQPVPSSQMSSTQASSTPQQSQTIQGSSPSQGSSAPRQSQTTRQVSLFSPLVGQVNPEISHYLLEAFENVIEYAKEKGIFSNDNANASFEQILREKGNQFINELNQQIENIIVNIKEEKEKEKID